MNEARNALEVAITAIAIIIIDWRENRKDNIIDYQAECIVSHERVAQSGKPEEMEESAAERKGQQVAPYTLHPEKQFLITFSE